jgi:hypothetical protein
VIDAVMVGVACSQLWLRWVQRREVVRPLKVPMCPHPVHPVHPGRQAAVEVAVVAAACLQLIPPAILPLA